MPNCGCEYGEPCNFHAAEQDAIDDAERDQGAVPEELDEETTERIVNVSMTQMALEWIARQRAAAAVIAP